LNPGKADAGRVAGMVESVNRSELLRLDVDGKVIVRWGRRAGNAKQVLEELDHVGRGGIDAAAGA